MPEMIERLKANIAKVYLGPEDAIDRLICCLLARGHALVEDVPGVGKTVLASALAKSVDCSFSRIQLTPDLLPSDVLGVSIFDRRTSEFEFKPGPIFANLVLADEINRTTPRTQTALLEAMNEATVSTDGEVRKLEQPFMLLATQNPYDFEGTYALPENQLDRFLIRLRLGYPSPEAERRVLEVRPAAHVLDALETVLTSEEIIELQEATDAVLADAQLLEYVVDLAAATRNHPEVRVGLSPRGSLALVQCARGRAFMDGREYLIPEDITRSIESVCLHRLVLRDTPLTGDDARTKGVLSEIVRSLTIPN